MISIIIPVYNNEKAVALCLQALMKQNFASNSLEVIVVDDGSTDNTADVVKQYPVKYIYQENAGPATARSTGWKAAYGEIVCFTDSDCIPERNWVEKIAKRYASDEIGGVGGSYDIANKDSLLARCVHEEIVQRHMRTSRETDYLGSFNLSYRKKVLEEVGGFNESFRQPSGEDNDLSYRVKKAGYKLIFDKDIKVSHCHQTNLIKYLKEQYRHGYWRMKLYKLHPDMTKGDSYAGVSDFAHPPLAMAITGTAIASFFYQPLFFFSCLGAALLLALQFPITLAAIKRNKRYSYLYLLPVLFLRAFARGFGMLKGIWRFFVL